MGCNSEFSARRWIETDIRSSSSPSERPFNFIRYPLSTTMRYLARDQWNKISALNLCQFKIYLLGFCVGFSFFFPEINFSGLKLARRIKFQQNLKLTLTICFSQVAVGCIMSGHQISAEFSQYVIAVSFLSPSLNPVFYAVFLQEFRDGYMAVFQFIRDKIFSLCKGA